MLGVLLSSKRLARQQGVALASLEAPHHPHPRLLLKHCHQLSIQQMCLQVHQSREVERVHHPRVHQSSLTSLPNHLASHPVRAQLRHPQPLQAPQRLAVQQPPPLPRRPILLRILLQNHQFHLQLHLPCQLVATPVLQFPRVNYRRVNGQQTTLNVVSVKAQTLISGGHVMLTFAIARGQLLLVTIA